MYQLTFQILFVLAKGQSLLEPKTASLFQEVKLHSVAEVREEDNLTKSFFETLNKHVKSRLLQLSKGNLNTSSSWSSGKMCMCEREIYEKIRWHRRVGRGIREITSAYRDVEDKKTVLKCFVSKYKTLISDSCNESKPV